MSLKVEKSNVMVKDVINLFLLVGFFLAILNIIKNVFQVIPFLREGKKMSITPIEMFLFGLSMSYMIALTIKGFQI